MASLAQRMIGAARLDGATYEEVEADAGATGQAALVVVLSSIATGIAVFDEAGFRGVAVGTLVNLVGWVLWATITYLVGTKVLPGRNTLADLGQLLRTLGFSASPGVLNVVGIVPVLGELAVMVVALWMLAAMVVAVKHALDYDGIGRAVAVCLLGFLSYAAVVFILNFLFIGATELTGPAPAR
jgi:hypothetical protein